MSIQSVVTEFEGFEQELYGHMADLRKQDEPAVDCAWLGIDSAHNAAVSVLLHAIMEEPVKELRQWARSRFERIA